MKASTIIKCELCPNKDYDIKMFRMIDGKMLCGDCYYSVTSNGQNLYLPVDSEDGISYTSILKARQEYREFKSNYLFKLKKYSVYYDDNKLLLKAKKIAEKLSITWFKKVINTLSTTEERLLLDKVLQGIEENYGKLSDETLKKVKIDSYLSNHPNFEEFFEGKGYYQKWKKS